MRAGCLHVNVHTSAAHAVRPNTLSACLPAMPGAGCDPDTCGESRPEPIGNQTIQCRLIGLPDINQSHPHVAETLYSWVDWLRDTYQIDGFRVDAAKHMYPVRPRKDST